MASFNKVLLMGNLTRDPELRYTGSGAAVCGLGLAVNRSYKTQSGEVKDDTCFVDVTVWGKQGESCNNYLRKGAPVFVEGVLRLESWTDKNTGQNRSRHSVSAESVRFLGAPQKGSGGFSDNPQSYNQGQPQQQPQQPQYQAQPAPQPSQPQAAPAPMAAPAPYSQQAPQAAPQPSQPQQAAPAPSFEPPPMPEFNTEAEDDIPF
ncbi:MAG: single-stranded DNA-binding protein [Lentisphaeraceae bacterium]|nr:single-stranded DNA-binding protein [Lentisphaeraceae bacterium]